MEKKNKKLELVIGSQLPLEEKLAARLGPEIYRIWREMWSHLSRLYKYGLISKKAVYIHIDSQIDQAVTKGLVDFTETISQDIILKAGSAVRVRALESSDQGDQIIVSPTETPSIESLLNTDKQRFWLSWVQAKLEELDHIRQRLSREEPDLYPPVPDFEKLYGDKNND